MEKGKEIRQAVQNNAAYFVKWTLIALLLGGIGGLVGGAFSRGIGYVTAWRQEHDWMLYLMPLGGLLIVWLYHVLKQEKHRGTNAIIDAVLHGEDVSIRTAPLIFFSTLITHAVGGSAGREGAALQLGGSIGSVLGRTLKLDEKDRRVATMCGMAAVFSALFGTPVAATVFCMEVFSIGILYYAALVPCIFASFLGVGIAGWMGCEPEAFAVTMVSGIELRTVLLMAVFGICCALVSIALCETLHKTDHILKKIFPNPYIRVVAASVLVIGITLLSGTRIYNGSSMQLIEEGMLGEAPWYAMILKLLLTAITLGGGFKGGEIVPTLCIGAVLGGVFGPLVGLPASMCAACGMVGLFAGVTNCPLASLLIALEMFGGEGLPYFAIVIAVSFVLSGYYGLYASQRFAYSKTKNEFVNRLSTK